MPFAAGLIRQYLIGLHDSQESEIDTQPQQWLALLKRRFNAKSNLNNSHRCTSEHNYLSIPTLVIIFENIMHDEGVVVKKKNYRHYKIELFEFIDPLHMEVYKMYNILIKVQME